MSNIHGNYITWSGEQIRLVQTAEGFAVDWITETKTLREATGDRATATRAFLERIEYAEGLNVYVPIDEVTPVEPPVIPAIVNEIAPLRDVPPFEVAPISDDETREIGPPRWESPVISGEARVKPRRSQT